MNLLQFDSEARWIEAVVSLWRDRLRQNPKLRHCLASGHTPLKIYAAMADSARRGAVRFSQSEIFALDEYGGLAADDPARCAQMLKHWLLDPAEIPAAQFHPLDPEAADLGQVSREFDAAIGPAGFDLAILGLGLNGHLGMNEPGTPPDAPTRRVPLHPTTIQSSAKYLSHSRLPTWGLGVGLKQLLSSKEIWLLVNGAAKAEIVARVLNEKAGPELPASWLRRHPNSWIFLDPAAGGKISAG